MGNLSITGWKAGATHLRSGLIRFFSVKKKNWIQMESLLWRNWEIDSPFETKCLQMIWISNSAIVEQVFKTSNFKPESNFPQISDDETILVQNSHLVVRREITAMSTAQICSSKRRVNVSSPIWIKHLRVSRFVTQDGPSAGFASFNRNNNRSHNSRMMTTLQGSFYRRSLFDLRTSTKKWHNCRTFNFASELKIEAKRQGSGTWFCFSSIMIRRRQEDSGLSGVSCWFAWWGTFSVCEAELSWPSTKIICASTSEAKAVFPSSDDVAKSQMTGDEMRFSRISFFSTRVG